MDDVLGSIFPSFSMDRRRVRWEDYLPTLTPVQRARAGGYYKRDDYFAPLGPGAVNGTNLRQVVYLVASARAAGATGVLTGASVLSPQISMAAMVAAHFGLPCIIVLGGTTEEAAIRRYPNVAIAARVGAHFHIIKVGYNPVLQAEVKRLAAMPALAGYYVLEYGITTPEGASDAEVERFHAIGAHQVRALPDGVVTVHMAAATANSCVSLLYGLAMHKPSTLRRVVLYQTGPDRRAWIAARLAAIQRARGLPEPPSPRNVLVDFVDLYGSGFAAYRDRMPAVVDGIPLHPTYEGKIMHARKLAPMSYGELLWIRSLEANEAPLQRYAPAPAAEVRSALGHHSVLGGRGRAARV